LDVEKRNAQVFIAIQQDENGFFDYEQDYDYE